MVNHCAEIANACPDKGRFGSVDWESVMKEKLYRMCLAITKAQPMLGLETVEQVKERLMAEYTRRKRMTRGTQSRHWVCISRTSFAFLPSIQAEDTHSC